MSTREREQKPKSAARAGGLLFVVSRDAVDRYEDLRRVFARDARVTVILDRRSGERRKTPSVRAAGRRRAERRSRPAIDNGLQRQGWAMVRRDLSHVPTYDSHGLPPNP